MLPFVAASENVFLLHLMTAGEFNAKRFRFRSAFALALVLATKFVFREVRLNI